jgi:hypothetical protein
MLDPAVAGPDFSLQGEYADGTGRAPVGAQVVARGAGSFLAVLWSGGLPGAGFDGRLREELSGSRDGSAVVFEGSGQARLEGGRLTGTTGAGLPFTLERLERSSPTLGASAPAGASTSFDTPLDEHGLLAAGATSRLLFGDATIHVEFRTPFEPKGRGQFRGNSGIYLQNRYEVQVLDSFGLRGEDNECGGIYQVSQPAQNMAFPPLSWQSFDIDFEAARFDGAGVKTRAARVTVRHNGVLIQDRVELPGPTGGGDEEGPDPGPLYLQDHWNPVFFRNVWILPKDAADAN